MSEMQLTVNKDKPVPRKIDSEDPVVSGGISSGVAILDDPEIEKLEKVYSTQESAPKPIIDVNEVDPEFFHAKSRDTRVSVASSNALKSQNTGTASAVGRISQ